MNTNLSEVKVSKLPSERIKVYLCTVNGKKNSFAAEVIVFDWLLVIVILNSFLIVRFEFVRSTDFTNGFLSEVYNVLSTELWNLEDKIARSVTVDAAAGGEPSQIPVTVVIPVTTINLSVT